MMEVGQSVGIGQESKQEYRTRKTADVQREFIKNISEGEDAKEAFIGAFAALSDKYNPDKDKFVSENVYLCKSFNMKKLINKDNFKFALEAIQVIVPMVLTVLDWFSSHKPMSTQKNSTSA